MIKQTNHLRRTKRVRSKVLASKDKKRLTVYRSNKGIYAQIIDNRKSETLISVCDKDLSAKDSKGRSRIEKAKMLGNLMAKLAEEKKIREVVYDRGGYKYHGRVKSFAEGAREGGLKF
jgi:large subunit ribosomal protein L18